MSATAEFCVVVHDNHCQAAPQGCQPRPGEDTTRARCYACGQPVCKSCSTVMRWAGGRHRVCINCETQSLPDGEARVLLRDYQRAGYTGVTLEDCVAQLAAQQAR